MFSCGPHTIFRDTGQVSLDKTVWPRRRELVVRCPAGCTLVCLCQGLIFVISRVGFRKYTQSTQSTENTLKALSTSSNSFRPPASSRIITSSAATTASLALLTNTCLVLPNRLSQVKVRQNLVNINALFAMWNLLAV